MEFLPTLHVTYMLIHKGLHIRTKSGRVTPHQGNQYPPFEEKNRQDRHNERHCRSQALVLNYWFFGSLVLGSLVLSWQTHGEGRQKEI